MSEYNRNGGPLLIFCDNEPFTFEANLLLKEYLGFDENKILESTSDHPDARIFFHFHFRQPLQIIPSQKGNFSN